MPVKKNVRNKIKVKSKMKIRERKEISKKGAAEAVASNSKKNSIKSKSLSLQSKSQSNSSHVFEGSKIISKSAPFVEKSQVHKNDEQSSSKSTTSLEGAHRQKSLQKPRASSYQGPQDFISREEVISKLRESLLNQKGLILNKSRNIEEEALLNPSDGVQDEADQASRQLSLNLSLNLHERDRNSLFSIEKALSRIQNGTYGHCDLCGIEIGLRRLQARPFASLCIDCMQDQEDLRLSSSPS